MVQPLESFLVVRGDGRVIFTIAEFCVAFEKVTSLLLAMGRYSTRMVDTLNTPIYIIYQNMYHESRDSPLLRLAVHEPFLPA
jgi:hypothetical protein